jgi:ABC-2 type transport system ATP-binding protein
VSETDEPQSPPAADADASSAETNPTPADVADSVTTNASVAEEPAPAVGASVPEPPPAPFSSPLVVGQSVTIRDTAGPRGRSRGSLNGINFSLGAGLTAFVGAPEDGTLALAAALSGSRPPSRGKVLVAGVSPDKSPAVRARIGVLSPEPVLPAAKSVSDLVAIAVHARGQTRSSPLDVLKSLGVDHLLPRNPRSLSFAETRAVELALALTTPSPLLVVLHEPLADIAVNLLGVVRERIRHLAETGACVAITTSSPADARALADDVYTLHRGSIFRDDRSLRASNRGTPLLVAWVRPAEQEEGLAPIRRLAQALAGRPEITSVAWNDEPHASAPAAEIRLSGEDLDACALALQDAATEVGAIIEAIAPASPGLTRLRAAAETAEALRRAATPLRPMAQPRGSR